MKEFKEQAPTPERIEEYIERPVSEAADKLRGLAPKTLAKAPVGCHCTSCRGGLGNGKRVRICAEGDEPIRYDRESNGSACIPAGTGGEAEEPTEVQTPRAYKRRRGCPMITCPHCGQEVSEFCKEKAPAAFGSDDSGERVPANGNSAMAWSPPRPHVKTNDVRLALLAYPSLTHKKIGEIFGISVVERMHAGNRRWLPR